jgi:hypothetical protein
MAQPTIKVSAVVVSIDGRVTFCALVVLSLSSYGVPVVTAPEKAAKVPTIAQVWEKLKVKLTESTSA